MVKGLNFGLSPLRMTRSPSRCQRFKVTSLSRRKTPTAPSGSRSWRRDDHLVSGEDGGAQRSRPGPAVGRPLPLWSSPPAGSPGLPPLRGSAGAAGGHGSVAEHGAQRAGGRFQAQSPGMIRLPLQPALPDQGFQAVLDRSRINPEVAGHFPTRRRVSVPFLKVPDEIPGSPAGGKSVRPWLIQYHTFVRLSTKNHT